MTENTNLRFDSRKRGRYVAYNRQTKMYLHFGCTSETPDRNYAWVGTLFQANNMKQAFPFSEGFTIYQDGTEKDLW